MQLTAQHLGTTKEDSRFRRGVDLADGAEDHVPIWAAEVGGCAETGDGVVVRVDVVDHDVGGVVGFDFGGEVLWCWHSEVSEEGVEMGEWVGECKEGLTV